VTPAPEADREQLESEFTAPLRSVLVLDPSILAVVFVDSGGECVDYCSRMPAHEAKVVGAVMDVTLRGVQLALRRLGAGSAWLVHTHTATGSLLARPVDDDYLLAVVAAGDLDTDALDAGLGRAATELRRLAGLRTPAWEPTLPGPQVSVRPARGWPHAPSAFSSQDGMRRVEAVLGRWEEDRPLAALELECFRVRTRDGDELTLSRDRRSGRWTRG